MTIQTALKKSYRLKFALVTETFKPEINGVAMTLGKITERLTNNQHQVQVIRPKQSNFDTPSNTPNFKEHLVTGMPIPFYKHLKFGLPAKNRLIKLWSEIKPDVVHIMAAGRIIKTGGPELALQLEAEGYDKYVQVAA